MTKSSVIRSRVKKFPIPGETKREVFFTFPKLVLFENSSQVCIKHLQTSDEKEQQDSLFNLIRDIVDKVLIDSILWIILESGNILAIDVITGTQIDVLCDNQETYKIFKLSEYNGTVIAVTEAGQYLYVPCKTADLKSLMSNGKTTYETTLKKFPNYSSLRSIKYETTANGLNMYINKGVLMMECPVTGLVEEVTVGHELEYVMPWQNTVILANKSHMWVFNLVDNSVLFVFDKTEESYYPLGVHRNTFYFATWDHLEITVWKAWVADSQADNQDHEDLNCSESKLSSQETLVYQLNCLVENALAGSECQQMLPQLIHYFKNIEDLQLLVKIAKFLCHYNTQYKSVLYCLQKRLDINDESLVKLVGELIIKVDLMEYVIFRGHKYYDNVNLFEQNFKELCVTFVTNSDFDLATICLLKYSNLKICVNADDILAILNSVPDNIKIGVLIVWLKNFVTTLIDQNPYFIDAIITWTMQRVFTLEKSPYWPKMGLKFIEEIKNVLEISSKIICIRPPSLDTLDKLKDHILYIMELKEKYKINMLLSELSFQNPNEVTLIMLRRCYTEDLEGFLQKFMVSYSARYNIDWDDVLFTFISSEAAVSGGRMDGVRLEVLLSHIRSPNRKLECLLLVLKVLDVPWDETVLKIATSAAASAENDFRMTHADHVLAQEIHKELNYAKVKVVLKKYNFSLHCVDYTLVLHKVVNAPVIDLHDLKVLLSVMGSHASYGHILYIDRCLQDCKTKFALEYLTGLRVREQKLMVRALMNKYEQIILSNSNDTVIHRNYVDFLKGSQMLNHGQVTAIDNLYHLKNSYDMKLTLNKLHTEQDCLTEIEKWTEKKESSASSGKGAFISKLTYTHETIQSQILKLLRRTSADKKVRTFVESLISSFMIKDTVEATKNVLSEFKDAQNKTLLIKVRNVLVDLLMSCQEEHVFYLMKGISVINALVNTNIVIPNLFTTWKFQYIFVPMYSVISINELIDYYENNESSHKQKPLQSNDFVQFRKVGDITYENTSNIIKMTNRTAKRLVPQVVTLEDLDELFITYLLLILGYNTEDNDSTWLLDLVKGHNETLPPKITNYLSYPLVRRVFSLDSARFVKSATFTPQYLLQTKFNINLASISLPDGTDVTLDANVIIFHVLKLHPSTSFERLVDFCRTLNVSVDHGLSLQLICLLTTWNLKYKICYDDLNCRYLCIDNDERELISQCLLVWQNISDKTFLKGVLSDLWKHSEISMHGSSVSINPYYHEVYLCIHHLIFGTTQIGKEGAKEYYLLNFLKDYRRKTAPKQYEFELFSAKGMFPDVGLYRLPFLMFMRDDVWSNLKMEITLETYELWLPVATLLPLPTPNPDPQTARDMVCSNALKRTMALREASEELKNSEWCLLPREEPLLRAAHKCVKHIANLEWAGACLFYVFQGCPQGADQVAAADLCYQFSQRWAAFQPDHKGVRKFERLFLSLSTRHALHKIDWATEDFLKLSTEPSQLIRALYLHPDFAEKISRHDVNQAANDIADKNGVNINSIRIQILENILSQNGGSNKSQNITGLDHRDLITAKYILKATCQKMSAIYLSRIALDDEGEFNSSKKVRALQCLMSMIDTDTSLKVTNFEREELWPKLLELNYIANLENIGASWLVGTFVQNKALALELLMPTLSDNTEGMKIAAELAIRYGNMQLIQQCIPILSQSSLCEDMVPLLLKLWLASDETVISSWKSVLVTPFQKADYPITQHQRTKCIEALNLLPLCPVIDDNDLIEIWKHCIRLKCYGIGCLVLPYVTPEGRQKLSELRKIDRRNLIANLKNLQSETYLVTGAMRVLEGMSRSYR